MEQNTNTAAAQSGKQLGILFGVLMVLEFVILYALDVDPIANPTIGRIVNIFNYLILPVLFISMACNSAKKSNHGFISFGQCLKTGVKLCVIAGLIYGIFSIIFNLIFPEFIEEVIRKTRNVMMESDPRPTTEQLEMSLTWVRKLMNPAFALPITLIMFSFLGLFYSLIIGAIVKKEQPQSF